MRLSKKKIILAIIIIIPTVIFIVIEKREMKESDFLYQSGCYGSSASLASRCDFWGGELRSEISSIGFGAMSAFGCYPQGGTTDAGKKCDSGIECEGDCVWLEGGILMKDSSHTCSRYKTPYFTLSYEEKGKMENFRLCE